MNRLIATLLAAALVSSSALAADPEKLIPYSGKLQVDTAFPGGSMDFTFSLYDAPTGGTQLWTRNQTVALNDGEFAVVFGDANGPALPEAVFTAGTLYLELAIQSTTLTPRQRIYAAPASVRANYSTFRVAEFLYLGPGQAAIQSPGRLHLSTMSEDIYLMAAKGVHVTKDWYGSGDFSVAGTASLNGGATASSMTVNGQATVNGDLKVTGTTTLNVYRVEASATAWTAVCSCGSDKVIGGGGYCAPNTYMGNSRPSGDSAWEVNCFTTFDQNWHGNATAYCICAKVK